jgi:hypothetical protein
MEFEASLPRLKKLANCPFTETDQSNPNPTLFLEDPVELYPSIQA